MYEDPDLRGAVVATLDVPQAGEAMSNGAGPMAGKICLVTGATSGIGLEAAAQLSRMGAEVLLCGRNENKLAGAVARIAALNPGAKLTPLKADLSSLDEIRRLSDSVHQKCRRLDVLINNAGAFFLERQTTIDGLERTFALNHLAYFALTLRLMDLLTTGNGVRIINIASSAHLKGRLDLDDLQRSRAYGARAAYRGSKLANVLFTFELARRLGPGPVTVNAVHPGLVATNFARDNGWRGWFIGIAFQLLGISIEKGARTMVYLASASQVAGVTGEYFANEQIAKCADIARDEALARRLWVESERLTGLSFPMKSSGDGGNT
jgi:retinol dehydrogenase-12